MTEKVFKTKHELDRFTYWAQKEKHLYMHPAWLVHAHEIAWESAEYWSIDRYDDYLYEYRKLNPGSWALKKCTWCYRVWFKARFGESGITP
jgi:hypothetical protein